VSSASQIIWCAWSGSATAALEKALAPESVKDADPLRVVSRPQVLRGSEVWGSLAALAEHHILARDARWLRGAPGHRLDVLRSTRE
jgi:hypothetical protein